MRFLTIFFSFFFSCFEYKVRFFFDRVGLLFVVVVVVFFLSSRKSCDSSVVCSSFFFFLFFFLSQVPVTSMNEDTEKEKKVANIILFSKSAKSRSLLA